MASRLLRSLSLSSSLSSSTSLSFSVVSPLLRCSFSSLCPSSSSSPSLSSLSSSRSPSSFLFSSRSVSSKAFTAVTCKNAPAAVGPYSHAVKSNGFVFVSGSLGLDPVTNDFPAKDVGAQTQQSLKNIESILQASGSSMERVVKTTILLADMNDFPVVNGLYAKFFPHNFPARATYAVKGLPKGALVEIEAVATYE